MEVYGSQTDDDVADRGLCNTHTHIQFSYLYTCDAADAFTDLWPCHIPVLVLHLKGVNIGSTEAHKSKLKTHFFDVAFN